ncbi:hypothetical protein LSAT2_022435 [Lamellibrachia satsuma]|nr:hypothetical protein LSAT2_022435 [Lamellibrachia satsuma]
MRNGSRGWQSLAGVIARGETPLGGSKKELLDSECSWNSSFHLLPRTSATYYADICSQPVTSTIQSVNVTPCMA